MAGRLRIDLDALAANYQVFRRAAEPGSCAGVVKADAYGLGLAPVARRLWREGCRQFFVASASEGCALRSVLPRARIYLFEGVSERTLTACVEQELTPVLNHPEQAQCWRAGAGARVAAVHVDTGMHRLGFSWDGSFESLAGMPVALLLTHLACADQPGHAFTGVQLERFERARAAFPGVPCSIGNSAGVLSGDVQLGNLGRPGIGLYGCNPYPDSDNPMANVATLEGCVLQVRAVDAGETVGYGASFHAAGPLEVAIVGIGYADGLPRLLSNRGMAWVAGARRPIIGRISMDLTAVDVTGLGVVAGDWIEFFGTHVPLAEVAGWAATIDYEVLTRLGPRLERIYRGA